MLELHYFLLGIVVILALSYFYNEQELMKVKETFVDNNRGSLKSVIVEKKDVYNDKNMTSVCRPFNYGRLVVLDDPNIPLDKQTEFQTEAENVDHPVNRVDFDKLDSGAVSENGEYNFGKTKWLFDGIWDRNCKQNGLDRDCKWKMVDRESKWTGGWDRHSVPEKCNRILEGKYGSNNFFHFPDKCAPVGQNIFTGDQCAGSYNGDASNVSKGSKGKICCYENCDDDIVEI